MLDELGNEKEEVSQRGRVGKRKKSVRGKISIFLFMFTQISLALSLLRVSGWAPSSDDWFVVGSVSPLLVLCHGRCVFTFDVVVYSLQCPKTSFLFFKDGLDVRIKNFSSRYSLDNFSPSVNAFTFLTISHLVLKSMLSFFSFQTCSLSVALNV